MTGCGSSTFGMGSISLLLSSDKVRSTESYSDHYFPQLLLYSYFSDIQRRILKFIGTRRLRFGLIKSLNSFTAIRKLTLTFISRFIFIRISGNNSGLRPMSFCLIWLLKKYSLSLLSHLCERDVACYCNSNKQHLFLLE